MSPAHQCCRRCLVGTRHNSCMRTLPEEQKIQTQKGSNKCLFILTWKHSMQIFRESPLSSHKTTLKQQINSYKQSKMREKKLIFFVVEFLSLVQCLEDSSCALNLPSTKQVTKTQLKQDFFLSRFSLFLTIYLLSFCGLTKGISPKICILYVRVKINKSSFEPFCDRILF